MLLLLCTVQVGRDSALTATTTTTSTGYMVVSVLPTAPVAPVSSSILYSTVRTVRPLRCTGRCVVRGQSGPSTVPPLPPDCRLRLTWYLLHSRSFAQWAGTSLNCQPHCVPLPCPFPPEASTALKSLRRLQYIRTSCSPSLPFPQVQLGRVHPRFELAPSRSERSLAWGTQPLPFS